MLVPVVEHNIAKEDDAWHGCDLLIAGDDAPGCVHGGVIEARQDLAHGGYTLVEGTEDFLHGCGLVELEVWRRDLVLLSAADDSCWNEGEVVCQLPSGHGPGVRLPGELVVGKALEELPRDGGLRFKFCE
jgi:hypothetical protein